MTEDRERIYESLERNIKKKYQKGKIRVPSHRELPLFSFRTGIDLEVAKVAYRMNIFNEVVSDYTPR